MGERFHRPWRLITRTVEESAIAEVERRIAAAAARRYGVITFTQLLSSGLNPNGVQRRLSAGRLFRLHRSVYSVVPPNLLRAEGRWLAAVYACGPGAVLSHTAAAALWDMRAAPSGLIHVTVPTNAGRRKRQGIAIHRSSTLPASQTTTERFIPVTTPARTLSDLRRLLPRSQYEACVRRAEKAHLDTGGVLDPEPEPDATVLERRLLSLCRRHSLALPETQVIIGPYTVDFHWPAQRLIVETDGFADHGPRSGFEGDRARDAWLMTQGYRVVRFTWRQLRDEAGVVAATLRPLL
jgi:very-short-patch-repair endonuclease